MSRLRIGFGLFALSSLLTGVSPMAVSAAELAEAGATGTLKIKVAVTGGGRVNSEGAGWDYYDWSVNNAGDLTFELTAMEPSFNDEQLAMLGGVSGGGDDEDGDWEQKWDDKVDACNGDEACEMRVTRQRMQDPRAQSGMAGAMDMMRKMQTGELDMNPTAQRWTIPVGAVRGTVSVRDHQDTYGIIDTGGGPPIDTHCTTSGEGTINRKPSGYGDLAPILTIDIKNSTYELHLPADEQVETENSCEQGGKGGMGLLGSTAKDAKGWPETMVVTGKLDAGAAAKFSGKSSWKGDRRGYDVEPTTVSVSWTFVQNP